NVKEAEKNHWYFSVSLPPRTRRRLCHYPKSRVVHRRVHSPFRALTHRQLFLPLLLPTMTTLLPFPSQTTQIPRRKPPHPLPTRQRQLLNRRQSKLLYLKCQSRSQSCPRQLQRG